MKNNSAFSSLVFGGDGVVSGGTLSGTTLILNRTNLLNDVNINLSSLSGGSGTTSPAGANTQIQFNDSGSFGASSGFTFNNTNCALTLGKRLSTSGNYSISVGCNNTATFNHGFALGKEITVGTFSGAFGCKTQAGAYGFATGQASSATTSWATAIGYKVRAIGIASHAQNRETIACGNNSHAEGNASQAIGNNSHAEGANTIACGNYSHTQGDLTRAIGAASHASGKGNSTLKSVFSCGVTTFNHSENNANQINGHGAIANNSAILGGLNHNIETSNVRAVILGGCGIKLTGTSYIDTTAVSKLAIISEPTSGNSTQILTRNETTGVVEYTSSSEFGGGGSGSTSPAGANTQIQFNNSGSFGANSGFTYDNTNESVSIGLRDTGSVGDNTLVIGRDNRSSGNNSLSVGIDNCACGLNSSAFGCNSRAFGYNSIAIGFQSIACNNSFASGYRARACGNAAHAEGHTTLACGNYSHTEGFCTRANGFAAHAGGCRGNAYGAYTFKHGIGNYAIGNNSVSFGVGTTSCGVGSFVGGYSPVSLKGLLASGTSSFVFSENDAAQVISHGAIANNSTILGGRNHNIEAGNVRSAIIGGDGIKLTGTTYIDTTAVDNLAIMSTPAGGGSEDVLTWNPITGKVNKITQGSVSDERLKTIIKPIKGSLQALFSLNSYEYEFNEKIKPASLKGQKRYGLIAQEVEKEFPYVVNNNLKIGDDIYKTIKYDELIPILVQAINELKLEIENLKNG